MRNRLLFAWRHLPPALLPLHGVALAWRLGSSRLSGDPLFRRALSAARTRWESSRRQPASKL